MKQYNRNVPPYDLLLNRPLTRAISLSLLPARGKNTVSPCQSYERNQPLTHPHIPF